MADIEQVVPERQDKHSPAWRRPDAKQPPRSCFCTRFGLDPKVEAHLETDGVTRHTTSICGRPVAEEAIDLDDLVAHSTIPVADSCIPPITKYEVDADWARKSGEPLPIRDPRRPHDIGLTPENGWDILCGMLSMHVGETGANNGNGESAPEVLRRLLDELIEHRSTNPAGLATNVMNRTMQMVEEDLNRLLKARENHGLLAKGEVEPLVVLLEVANRARLLRDALVGTGG